MSSASSAGPAGLDAAAIERYRVKGWLSPFRAFDAAQANDYRRLLEDGEARHGSSPDRRRKMHLYLQWVDEIIRLPQILDRVESVIGPDLLVYTITLWLKEPKTEAFVSWHQDSTYFGLDPADQHLSAWVALSPSTELSGCVAVLSGSHQSGQRPHQTEAHPANLFGNGQTVAVDGSARIDTIPLAPGEFSLHHTHLLHHSQPNRSDDRRIGLGISYIPTRCRCRSKVRLSATLVRGEDRYGHFDLDPRPTADFAPEALAVHRQAVERWHRARAELIPLAHSGG